MWSVLASAALAWEDVDTGVRVAWSAEWSETALTLPLDGAKVQAVHGPTGGGLVVRTAPFDAAMFPEHARAEIGDVDAAVTADRWVRAIALSQTDGSADRTLYLGLSDVAGARVGRWVFREPGADGPARVWWHAVWRVDGGFAQIVAWVPEDRIAAFVPAMRAIERDLGAAPAALLLRADGGCDGPASVDRMGAIAASARFATAKGALASGAWTDGGRALAELSALGAIVDAADRCVREAAREARACEVWERPSDTERSAVAQAALVRCIGADKATGKSLPPLLAPR